jgi:hypothetical protein
VSVAVLDAPEWALWLLDRADQPICQLDDVATWQYERRVNQVSTAQLTLSLVSPNLLDVWPFWQRLAIRVRTRTAGGAWETSEDWGGMMLTRGVAEPQEGKPALRFRFTFYHWMHYLRSRLIIPPLGQEYLSLDNLSADAACKEAVRHSLASIGGYADARAPALIDVSVAPDDNVGGFVKYSARFERLYDVVTTLAGQGSVKFDVVRVGDAPANQVEFTTYYPLRGIDRTVGNADGNAPAIFSVELATASSVDYTEDASALANYVYAGGQGSGLSRVFSNWYDTTSMGLFDRWEAFVDARGAVDVVAVSAVAAGYVNAHCNPDTQVSFTLPQTGGLLYKRDWDLGDKVTIRIVELGVTLEAEVMAVKVIGGADTPVPLVTPTLGTPLRDFIDRVADLKRGLDLNGTR